MIMTNSSTMRWSEPSLSSNSANNTNNPNSNLTTAISGSTSTPTIKNHSVTYHRGLLYCFGGYDGRKNHQTLLIYSLKEHRWLTVASVPNGVNSISDGDGEDDGGGNPVHRHIQNSRNDSGSIHGSRRVTPPRYVVTGTPPPGRNGHTATLATCCSRRRRRRVGNPLGGESADEHVPMNAPAKNDSGYLQAKRSLESKSLRQNLDSLQQREEKGLEDAVRETSRLSISPPLCRDDLTLECSDERMKTATPICAASDDNNRCRDQEIFSNMNDYNNNLQQNSDKVDDNDSDDTGNNQEAAESGFHQEAEVDRVLDAEEEEFIDDEEDAQIIIIGGWLGSGPLAASDMWVLDISGGLDRLRWFQPPSRGTPPGPCNMHSADFIPSLHQVYVFRGGNGREYLNDLHALDVETYTWHPVQTTGCPPQQRANHSSAVLTWNGVEELFIFGGWNGSERLNDVHLLDTATGTWSTPRISGVKPHPRAGMTLTALRGRLYLFGGSGTSSKCFDDLQILDRREMAWLDVNDGEDFRKDIVMSMKGGNHDNFTGMGDEDIFSGQDGVGYANGRNDGNRNIKFVDWRTQEGGNPSGLGGACRSVNPNDEDMVPSVFITGKPPGKRAGHTATAAGRHIFIFGGSCGSDYLSDSFVLDTDPPPLMNITEPTSLQLYARRLRHFYDDEEFSDVTFIVENRKVHGHKLVLSCVSDCFRAMFMTGFRESASGCTVIEIPNCRYDIFVTMMNYIYSGQLPEIDVFNTEPGQGMDRVIALLELADQFFLYNLKQICEKILQPAVNADTYSFLLQVAQKTNSMQLESYCQYFERNIHEFLG